MTHNTLKHSQATTSVLDRRAFRLAVYAGIALFTVLYIFQVNMAATAGFTMRDIERDIDTLKMDQRRLDMDVARLQSIDSVTTRIQMLGLTRATNVEYLRADSSVAVK